MPDSSGDEEGGQRGEDEPLLAPMPNQPKAQASNPPQSTVSFKEAATTPKQGTSLAWLPWVAMLGTIAIGAVMVAKQRQRRVERRR